MRKYKVVDVSEQQLEEMIGNSSVLIEDGLVYVDHQRRTDRGPFDVLFVDSGKALVVAELKVVEDDGMLAQGLDYYDYISRNVEGYARAYKNKRIDPTQKPRLFLIAPSFSSLLLNRCKWIDIPVSLFTYQCIEFDDKPNETIPVFKELTIPSRPEALEIPTIDKRLAYITEESMKETAAALLDDIRSWDEKDIRTEAKQYDISIKFKGRVFAYLAPRRKHFVVYTYDTDGEWKGFPIRSGEDLENTRKLLRKNYEEEKPKT